MFLIDPTLEQTQFSGDILKSDQTHTLPSSLAIKWMNFLDGDDIKDGTAWAPTMGVSISNASHFLLEMEMTENEFAQNITTHPKRLKIWSRSLMDTPKAKERFENFKFAIGRIYGVYGKDDPSTSARYLNDNILGIISKGPSNETAFADIYAVFYKQGKLEEFINMSGPCTWYTKFPQGFSCGVGATQDNSCRGYDKFIPISCSEIVLKVAARYCNRDLYF